MNAGSLLVLVRELSEHINEPILSDEDVKQATSFIRAASAKVRACGDSSWSRWNCPEIAFTVALEAAGRGYQNPAGYDGERADTQNFGRHDMYATGTELTESEKEMLREEAGLNRGFTSVRLVRPDTPTETKVQ